MIKGSLKSNSNKKSHKKPSWDSTISDLNVYKLSPEELLQRKLDHVSKHQQVSFQSNNDFTSKPESVYDRLTKIRYGNHLKENEANHRKKIVSNMFTSEKELFDLFEQSEKALSTVESLFGDPLKRYKVNPVVTPCLNLNSSINKENNYNSNNCALNEYSDSENEISKSEMKSLHLNQTNDKDDELSKFRNFIENERQLEQSLDNQRIRNNVAHLNGMKVKLDAFTETEHPLGESNDILRYIHERIVKQVSFSDYPIPDCDKELADKVIDHLIKLNEKNSIKIQLLNSDINKNKELIDALTLVIFSVNVAHLKQLSYGQELMDNNEKMNQMKNEYETFTKNVTTELSGLKSMFIKYLDQQVASTLQPNAVSPTSNSNSRPKQLHYIENSNFHVDTPAYGDQTELLLSQQLNSLQIEHKETQKRLKNLLKIQDSLSQVSGNGE